MSNWYDSARLAAALAAAQPGADGRKILTGQGLLSALNPIAAPQWVPGAGMSTGNVDQNGNKYDWNDPGYFISSNGTKLNSPDGGQTFSDQYDNPTGNGSKDQAHVTYRIDPASGQAVPISADNAYNPSGWVDGGRFAAMIAATLGTAGVAGAALGGGAAAAGGAGASAGGGGGALGYGVGYAAPSAGQFAGMTVAQLDAAAAGLGGAAGAAGGAAASTAAPAAGAAPAAAITPAQAAGGALSAGSAAGGGGGASSAGGLLGSGGQLVSGVSNGQLLSTAGGLIGAAVGGSKAGGSLNSATTTNQSTVDPRVGQYIYGQNGNSGLLGNVNGLMNSQLATGGLNATQTQGLNMQLSALQDPAYGQSLQQIRSAGAGLLGGGQAGNPFTSQTAGSAGLLGAPGQQQAMPPGWTPMQTQLNQPQNPMQQQRPQMGSLLSPPRSMAY